MNGLRVFTLVFVLFGMSVALASADTDSRCDAAYEGDDYGGASVACLYAYEEHYNAAADEHGQARDLDMLLAGESLEEAGYANIVSGLDVTKGQEQRARAAQMVNALRTSKYPDIAHAASKYYAIMVSTNPSPPDDPW